MVAKYDGVDERAWEAVTVNVFRAIIFDLDGTLLDTLEDLALSVNAVLGENGFPGHPVDAYRIFVGDGIELLMRRAMPVEDADGQLVKTMVDAVREEYRRRWADHTRPYPGIPELLDFLEERRIPKAVFSNKPHELTTLTVDGILSRWSFTAVEGARPGVARKPDPAGVLNIAKRMKVEPREIVCLGDSNTDMQTATAAGMHPVGAVWGFRDAGELLAAGAKLLAINPMEVAALFRD